MKLEIKSFRTKVSRRIFILFIICAILPVSAITMVSFIHVRSQLINQCDQNLRQESKSLAVSFYERLVFLRSEMRFMASNYAIYSAKGTGDEFDKFTKTIGEHFNALALFSDGKLKSIYGVIKKPLRLSPGEWRHLMSGEALLHGQVSSGPLPGIFMCIALDPESHERDVLVGEISWPYILEAAERKPPFTELCVMDRSNSMLFSSMPEFSRFPDQVLKHIFESASGQFQWRHHRDEYIASYSSIFLKPNFYYPEWIVVLSELKADVLAPMANFKLTFPFIIVFTLGLVFFLSMSLIRKSMGPIVVLKNATRKIAEGLFGHRVSIKSGDEFESLGNDFNEMSTKLKESQDLLVHAAKMSTMGQMAAGIMHEIKQPLAAIYGLLELSLIDKSEGSEREKRLKTMFKAVSRLNTILERFQSFSSRSKETMDILSLNHNVTQVHELMEHELNKKTIQCIIDMEENLPPIYGDNQGLHQVVSNLLVNAMHALEDKADDNRTIVMRTYSSEEDVYLSIEDNGCGIPKELQERIFDPFFTTKTSSKGTGLGMAIVQSILHRHGAKISVESEKGTGTNFTIAFPKFNKKEAV